MDNDFKTQNLNSNWKIWFHKSDDNEWGFESYIKLAEFNNLKDFAIIINGFEPLHIQNAMLFIMRANIKPMWEAEENKNGGSMSFKIYKKDIYDAWLQLVINLVGENLLKEKKNHNKINGISISPKKTFSIMKIWFSDNTINESKYLNNMDKFNYNEIIYKEHSK